MAVIRCKRVCTDWMCHCCPLARWVGIRRLSSSEQRAQMVVNPAAHVITKSKLGREAWAGKIFIYCKGDGAEVHKIIYSLQSLGGSWSNLKIVATGEQIGIRESRRIHGLYTVSRLDLIKGARFEDAVCRVTFGVDVHSVKKEDEVTTQYNRGTNSKPYDIPIRALTTKDFQATVQGYGQCRSDGSGSREGSGFGCTKKYSTTGCQMVRGEMVG